MLVVDEVKSKIRLHNPVIRFSIKLQNLQQTPTTRKLKEINSPPILLTIHQTSTSFPPPTKMPLQTTNLPASTLATSLATTASSTSRPTFLVVYASLTGGRSWCGDCRVAEPFVNAKFSGDLEAAVVYAGQPAEYIPSYLEY